MFVLHIDLPVKDGMSQALEQAFTRDFQPAIARREGLRGVELLRSVDDPNVYCLTIAFENPESQQKWVATDIHQQVWAALQDLCTGFSLREYNGT